MINKISTLIVQPVSPLVVWVRVPIFAYILMDDVNNSFQLHLLTQAMPTQSLVRLFLIK